MRAVRHYYNEIDSYCAQWLRNLIDEKMLPAGDVDERSIRDVSPGDVAGYTSCHFFAGLGGWPWSLRLAGWPDDRPIWTGSYPCQPFSVAGRRQGFADDRHLWPVWERLIAKRRPPSILGEQTAKAADWLALVRGDLEALDYAMGAIPIEAASAGADHFRDRYFFVAYGDEPVFRSVTPAGQQPHAQSDQGAHAGPLADGHGQRLEIPVCQSSDFGAERKAAARGDLCALEHAQGERWGQGWTIDELRRWGITAAVASVGDRQIIECPDGKWRRLPPPGVRWLGTRIPARIPKVRAFGNAIDTRPAVAFIRAVMQCS